MQEVDAMDFYSRVTDENAGTEKQITLENADGAALEVTLTVVDRKYLLDQITKLPDEMMEALSEADDPDEAEEEAREANLLTNVNGDTIEAFESICTASMEHEELTSHHFHDICEELDFEVLFPIGADVIEMSFENTGAVTDFHEADGAKNSS